MLNIKVTVEGGHVYLATPFVPGFNADAKNAGGSWDGGGKRWRFAASQEERVRELARDWWGTDGEDAYASDLVTVRMLVIGGGEAGYAGGIELYRLGRKIASRAGRDAPVILGPDVVLVEGGFASSGGSMKYPVLAPHENTWVEVLGVPRNAVPEGSGMYRIIEPAPDHAALAAERARIVERLAEIDRILAAEPALPNA